MVAAAWAAVLVSFLFWTGLAQGGVVLAASFHLTGARWGRTVQRLAAAWAAFLPVSLLLLTVLWLGRHYLFPWPPERSSWLRVGPLFLRDGAALLLMTVLSLAFLVISTRHPDREVTLRALSVAIVICFFPAFGLLAVDLVMAQEMGYHSTSYPLLYLAGCFDSALGATAVSAAVARKAGTDRLREALAQRYFLDLGNLFWGFSLFVGYLWWCDYFVFWMGNLPDEARHHLERWHGSPWTAIAWAAMLCSFLVPGVLLLSRGLKRSPAALAAIGVLATLGVLLQRVLEVMPPLRVMPRLTVAMILAGVMFVCCVLAVTPYLWVLRRYGPLPEGDPLLAEAIAVRGVVV